jgi:ribosomal protein S6--L-glutamate ligase
MVVSLHPHFSGDIRVALTPGKEFSREELLLFSQARAAIVPQSIKEKQYEALRSRCRHIFPSYASRFHYPGKVGNMRLFQRLGLPHPRSVGYVSVADFHARHPGLATSPHDYPFVLKGNEGGGGTQVFLVRNREELFTTLFRLSKTRSYPTPIVAQEFIPHGGRDLRVVVVGRRAHTYWRVQENRREFRCNVGQGAVIDPEGPAAHTKAGRELALALCAKAEINLAAVDVVFDATSPVPCPMLLEINFVFGRKGLGGSGNFRRVFAGAAEDWCRSLPDSAGE